MEYCSSFLFLMCFVNADCSGAAQAGLKWLRRAGFGHVNNVESGGDDSQPLHHLSIVYNPQIRYTTFHFTITPALAQHLPIPGGYHDSKMIYTCIPDKGAVPKSVSVARSEGETRKMLCSSSSRLLTLSSQSRLCALFEGI